MLELGALRVILSTGNVAMMFLVYNVCAVKISTSKNGSCTSFKLAEVAKHPGTSRSKGSLFFWLVPHSVLTVTMASGKPEIVLLHHKDLCCEEVMSLLIY